jgi:hypothetical protein
VSFVNANLPAAQTRFAGADDRPRWTRNRIHLNIVNAIVLGNQNDGDAWNVAASFSKTSPGGFLKAAYAYHRSRSVLEPGALGSAAWTANPQSADPNNPGLEYFGHGHRAFVAGSLSFKTLGIGTTTCAFFLEGRSAGNASYTYGGDLNGDSGAANDLIYVPRDVSEMNFQTWTFTPAEQAAAWDAYIAQDDYLRTRRGQYAERNGVVLPVVWRLDLGIAQDVVSSRGPRRHTLQFRADFLNLTNLLNSHWGVAKRLVSAQPLTVTNMAVDADGRATYRLRAVNNQLIASSLQPGSSIMDVYRIQFGLRYSFN